MEKTPSNSQILYDLSLKEKSRDLRNNMTPAEVRFWNTLRTMPFYQQFPFNRQKPLGKYIVDFYCSRLKLVVEIDGDIHATEQAELYDKQRDHWLGEQGVQVIRFSNREVLNEINGVMETMEGVIEKRQRE